MRVKGTEAAQISHGTTEHTWITRCSLILIMATTLGHSLASVIVTQMTRISETTGDRTTIASAPSTNAACGRTVKSLKPGKNSLPKATGVFR